MSGRILIIDQVVTNRIVLKVRLSAAHYDVLDAANAAEGLEIARTTHPDLVIVPARLDDMDAPTFCKTLLGTGETRDTPVLVLSDTNSDADRLACLHAGAQDVLPRRGPEHQFLAHIRRMLRASATDYELRLRETTNRALGFAEDSLSFETRANAVVVLDEEVKRPDWCTPLSRSTAISAQFFARSSGNWGNIIKSSPDVLVVPLNSTSPKDLSIITELRSTPSTRTLPIVAILERSNAAQISMALDLGADDLAYHDSPAREISLRIQRQAKRKHVAERLRARVKDGLRAAVTDPLTGLFNRRYAMPHLDQIATTAQSTGKPYALMMLDLDRFKEVNDTYGHPAGDAVLVEVAKRLQENLRAVDLIARMGGEEFMIVMPSASLYQAKAAANRLRKVICATPISVAGGSLNISASISIGLAMGGGDGRLGDTEHVLQLADNAMIQAKTDGRNLVMISRSAAA